MQAVVVYDTQFGNTEQVARAIAQGLADKGPVDLLAAAEFVRRTGKVAAIGALDDALAVLEGRSGTTLIEQSLVAVW